MQTAQKIGEMIEGLVKAKGMTVKQMLKECGLAHAMVDNIKRGSMPAADKLKVVADYLGVSVDGLLEGERVAVKEPTKFEEDFGMNEKKRLEHLREMEVKLVDIFNQSAKFANIFANQTKGLIAISDATSTATDIVTNEFITNVTAICDETTENAALNPLVLNEKFEYSLLSEDIGAKSSLVSDMQKENAKSISYLINAMVVCSKKLQRVTFEEALLLVKAESTTAKDEIEAQLLDGFRQIVDESVRQSTLNLVVSLGASEAKEGKELLPTGND